MRFAVLQFPASNCDQGYCTKDCLEDVDCNGTHLTDCVKISGVCTKP